MIKFLALLHGPSTVAVPVADATALSVARVLVPPGSGVFRPGVGEHGAALGCLVRELSSRSDLVARPPLAPTPTSLSPSAPPPEGWAEARPRRRTGAFFAGVPASESADRPERAGLLRARWRSVAGRPPWRSLPCNVGESGSAGSGRKVCRFGAVPSGVAAPPAP